MASEVEFWRQDPATKADHRAGGRTIIAPSPCVGALDNRIHSCISNRGGSKRGKDWDGKGPTQQHVARLLI
jgi:hypothetical protein